jgi:hypothetical protein
MINFDILLKEGESKTKNVLQILKKMVTSTISLALKSGTAAERRERWSHLKTNAAGAYEREYLREKWKSFNMDSENEIRAMASMEIYLRFWKYQSREPSTSLLKNRSDFERHHAPLTGSTTLKRAIVVLGIQEKTGASHFDNFL